MQETCASRSASGVSPAVTTVGLIVWTRQYRDLLGEFLRSTSRFAGLDIGEGTVSDLQKLARARPDVVLVDLPPCEMPGRLAEAHAAHPEGRYLGLNREERESELLELFECGLMGFVPRGASVPEIIASIEACLRGEVLCPPSLVGALVRRINRSGGAAVGLSAGLTQREVQIGRLVERGLTNKEIAGRLGIAGATVKNHVHSVLRKLGASRRNEAAAKLRDPTRHPSVLLVHARPSPTSPASGPAPADGSGT